MKNKISILRRELVPILKRNGVVKAGIFGSCARGEQTKKSDIDILVQFKGRKGLIAFIELQEKLEEKLKMKVDLVTYKSVHPLLKQKILGEEIRIL